jgi:hypothetical protein
MNRRTTPVLLILTTSLLASTTLAAPAVDNGSFEADRYTKWAGGARNNGGKITGWEYAGNAGVNPIWRDPQAQRGPDSPFHDNGKVPHGRQLALIQGPGKLSQKVTGFEKGRRYMVTYRENARIQRQGTLWPQLRVMLGGQVVVSAHEVTPVGRRDDFSVPFCRVESGSFTAPDDGTYELVLETIQESPTTTILLDDIRIIELPPGAGG